MKHNLSTLLIVFTFFQIAVAENFTNGVFVVNEDWYGHSNSTVNFLKDGKWQLRAIAAANGGIKRLGATACFGTIYGDDFYIISKQANDGGDGTSDGGRLVIVNASTLSLKSTLSDIDPDDSTIDGRAVLPVSTTHAYVSTSKGVYLYDVVQNKVTGKIDDIDASQTGTMLRACNNIFIVNQAKGIYVLNPANNTVIKNIPAADFEAKSTFSTIVQARDGMLYAPIVSTSGASLNKLLSLNPATLETRVITLADEVKGPVGTWAAWSPTTFIASKKTNSLYWTNGTSTWTSGYYVYRYDIDTNSTTKIIDLQAEGEKKHIYGCSLGIDPIEDTLLMSVTIGGSYTNQVAVRKYDSNGTFIAEYPLPDYYWFPGMFVFTDDFAPTVGTSETIEISSEQPTRLSLEDLVSDRDGMSCSIAKTVASIDNHALISSATIDYSTNLFGDLIITPTGQIGETSIDILCNSNGKTVNARLSVKTTSSGVEPVSIRPETSSVYYTTDGVRLNQKPAQSGIYINVKDGKASKIFIR